MLVSSLESDGETLSTLRLGSGGPTFVFLHGAGQSNKFRLLGVMNALALTSTVFSFDFSGHGDSTGTLAELSLKRRARQATDFCAPHSVDVLVGISMSGQTVSDIVNTVQPRGVALINPAAYTPEAWTLPFDRGFTEVIRQPNSWNDSAAFGELERFGGRKLVLTSTLDRVIPPGVVDRYCDAGAERLELVGAGHQVTKWLESDPERTRPVAEAIGALGYRGA